MFQGFRLIASSEIEYSERKLTSHVTRKAFTPLRSVKPTGALNVTQVKEE